MKHHILLEAVQSLLSTDVQTRNIISIDIGYRHFTVASLLKQTVVIFDFNTELGYYEDVPIFVKYLKNPTQISDNIQDSEHGQLLTNTNHLASDSNSQSNLEILVETQHMTSNIKLLYFLRGVLAAHGLKYRLVAPASRNAFARTKYKWMYKKTNKQTQQPEFMRNAPELFTEICGWEIWLASENNIEKHDDFTELYKWDDIIDCILMILLFSSITGSAHITVVAGKKN